MSYLKFDKQQLTNLQKSLDKEVLRTNRAGAYSSTTIIDCNTRKYHGTLVVPVPNLGPENFVLLSSLDETIIQHDTEFNLGLHKYGNEHYSPKGHKYIREFHLSASRITIYRVGGVILKKERIFESGRNRLIIAYTLLEAHSPTTLRLKPFLAFRSVNELMHENPQINKNYRVVTNGNAFKLYEGFPELFLQTSKPNTFVDTPNWYKGIEYYKEQERGYDYKEDLYVPGYYEMVITKGETIFFTASTIESSPEKIEGKFNTEKDKRIHRTDFQSTLKNAAEQFYTKRDEKDYLIPGYPWFNYRTRDAFIALPGTTLSIGRIDMFEKIMKVHTQAVHDFMLKKPKSTRLKEVSAPDNLLWFVWDIQMYAQKTSLEQTIEKYGALVLQIINFIRKQEHPNLFLHDNGLVFTNGTKKAASWMNATLENKPIVPRTGYIVEINALWYNTLCFGGEIAQKKGLQNLADGLNYQAKMAQESFNTIFWNGTYLYDYVVDHYNDQEIRPNMLFAVSLPHSPLDKKRQKSVLDLITRELLTTKGLRSLSPKSGMYRPNYVGTMNTRILNYHNGPVWPWTTDAYVEAYLKIYQRSGLSMMMRLLAGFENELTELTIGTLSELFDGNPPYRGHGAMAYAPSVAAVIRAQDLIDHSLKDAQDEPQNALQNTAGNKLQNKDKAQSVKPNKPLSVSPKTSQVPPLNSKKQ